MSISELQQLDCKDVRKFSLEGLEFDARVASVYDGDTITVVFKMKVDSEYCKWNCRLNGIDTAELKTGNHKEEAIKARDFLREKILDKVVRIKCGDFDKYGRLLVQVFQDNIDINALMIDSGHAKAYFGGKKDTII
jgi:endonuclease YncB( thermonuclease family)